MSWIRSPTGRSVIGILAAFGVMFGVVFMMRAGGFHFPGAVRLGIAVAIAVPAAWFAWAYWRSLDEAAREAQKWAWFWGGSGGLAIGFLAVGMLADALGADLAADASPERLMLLGGATVVLSQLVGFFLAWALWWWRRR